MTDCVDEALALMASPTPGSGGLLGNAADIYPELVRRGVRPGLVTDQTSAHDPVNGYLPQGWTLDRWMAERESAPAAVAMKDGSDAVADWPQLNALLHTASGATWVSLHHGGGVGMGYSQHAGMVIVADGTEAAARRLERVLWNDPGTGVMRHADAGYEEAIACAREQGLDLPMVNA